MTQTSLPLRTTPTEWHGALSGLLGVLTHEAAGRPIGTWVHRLLRGGALTSLKITHDKRRVLRIAREKKPETPAQLEAWSREVQTFLAHFHAEHWQPQPAESATGIAVRFIELFHAEIAPGQARCPACGAAIPFDLVFGRPDACPTCGATQGGFSS